MGLFNWFSKKSPLEKLKAKFSSYNSALEKAEKHTLKYLNRMYRRCRFNGKPFVYVSSGVGIKGVYGDWDITNTDLNTIQANIAIKGLNIIRFQSRALVHNVLNMWEMPTATHTALRGSKIAVVVCRPETEAKTDDPAVKKQIKEYNNHVDKAEKRVTRYLARVFRRNKYSGKPLVFASRGPFTWSGRMGKWEITSASANTLNAEISLKDGDNTVIIYSAAFVKSVLDEFEMQDPNELKGAKIAIVVVKSASKK